MPIDHGSAAGLDEGSGRLSKRSPLTLFVIGIWCVAGKLITRKGYQIRHQILDLVDNDRHYAEQI